MGGPVGPPQPTKAPRRSTRCQPMRGVCHGFGCRAVPILIRQFLSACCRRARCFAADKPSTINIDWATYNPVSILPQGQGPAREGIREGRHQDRWVQTLGSNKALEFLNAGSIDFGSTRRLGRAGRQDQRQPDQVDLCLFASRMDRACGAQGSSTIGKIADLKGKRVAVHARHRSAHLPGAPRCSAPDSPKKTSSRCCCSNPDGKTALIRGDVDAWARTRSDDAQAEVEDGAKLFYRDAAANTWGILNVREEFAKQHPDLVKARCSPSTRRRANIRWRITTK